MLAYALLVGFVVAFITIAGVGHLLLLKAVWPNLFGTPQSDIADAEVEFAAHEPAPPQGSQLAA